MEEIFIKRIYEPFDENDGERILIDRKLNNIKFES
jgi:uncharacterized protein YeaO (DUF488 family)